MDEMKTGGFEEENAESKKASPEAKKPRLLGQSLQEYFTKSGRTQVYLAQLLNVTPGTVNRWASQTESSPGGAEYLVLLPILLAANVEALEPQINEGFVSFLRSYGDFLNPNLQPEQKEAIRRRFMLRSSADVKAARKLFEELKRAWAILEKDAGLEEEGIPWPA